MTALDEERILANAAWIDPTPFRDLEIIPVAPAEPGAAMDQPESWPMLTDYTRWMQYQDTVTYLPGDILHKVDRATMGVSLESRAPYLDHRVVEKRPHCLLQRVRSVQHRQQAPTCLETPENNA